MRRVVIALVVVLAFSGVTMAQVAGTAHDMSSTLPTTQQVCVFCHTPHQPTGVIAAPLWNHTVSSNGAYGVYVGTSIQALDLTAVDSGDGSVSSLCMSCHDGTVGLGALYNDPNLAAGGEETPTNSATTITGNANMGTDLSNDHPVNFTYDATLEGADGGLNDPTAAPISGWLVGGKVQCSSCHDVHDNTFYPFLRATNVGSALCTACHQK